MKLTKLIIIYIFMPFIALASENTCDRILNNYVSEVASVRDVGALTSKYKRTIAPATDYLNQYQAEVLAAKKPSEELKAKALSKSRNPQALQNYIDFKINHRSTRVPEELMAFLASEKELVSLISRQGGSVYLKNANYSAAIALGEELYDLHRKAKQANCGTQELLRLTECAKMRLSAEAIKIKLRPYLDEAKENALALQQFEKNIPKAEIRMAQSYLSAKSSIDYELSRKDENQNYALLLALEKFDNAASIKVESYDLAHSNGDRAPLHVLRNQQQAIVGFAFGKPIDVASTNSCKDLYLLFDLNESTNYFKMQLLGYVQSRIDLRFKESARIKTYLNWVNEAAAEESSRATATQSSSLRRFLPTFLGGTSR